MRTLGIALAVLLLVSGPLRAESTRDQELARHRIDVALERREAFVAAWLASTSQRQAEVRSLFQQSQRFTVPSVYSARESVLDDARRALEGRASGAAAEWGSLADSLDLRVVPGAAPPCEAGELGTAMTVHVSPIYPVAATRDVELELEWTLPNGDRVSARKEPVARTALRSSFEMYVRVPPGPPGDYWLRPRLHQDELVVDGTAVRVEVIANLEERVQALDPAGRARIFADLRLELGLRTATQPSLREILELGRLTDEAPKVRRIDSTGTPFQWTWSPAGVEPRAAVAVAALPGEDPSWFLAGATGEAWRAVAARRGWRLFGISATGRDGVARSFVQSLEEIRRLDPELPVWLVVRGEAVSRLILEVRGRNALPFERLVVSSLLFGDRLPRSLTGVPELFLQCFSADHDPEPVPGTDLTWVRRFAHPAVAELALPELIADWTSD